MRSGLPPLLVLVLLFPAAGAPAAEPAPASPAPGVVAPKLTCTSDPTRSYALYLPLSYDPARPAPVLYLMDARGRALAALERFREGAERFGTVLASSYDSASDRQVDPNSQALAAMWRDTHQRLRLDDGRVYLGGFSGTARAAIEMALAERGKIAGVIAAGAGFPSGSAPEAGLPFVLFGTAGDEDFNYDEMLQLDETLDRLGIVHRIEVFRGGHDWMPARLASRALAWMELQAMAAAKRNREASLISSLWTEALGEARSLEQEGRPSEAARLYRATAADFRGLLDVAEASEPALRLAGSERVRRERREDENLRRRERQVLSEAWRLLGAASSSSSVSSDPARLPAALRLDEWKRKSRGKDPRLAASARRILNALLVQTAYYLPEEASRRKDDRAVILCLTVAAAIRPEDPELLYRLAAARARAGDSREALRSLERAVQRGFADLERLRQDDDFKRLRGDRAYRRLEAEVEGRRGVRPPAS